MPPRALLLCARVREGFRDVLFAVSVAVCGCCCGCCGCCRGATAAAAALDAATRMSWSLLAGSLSVSRRSVVSPLLLSLLLDSSSLSVTLTLMTLGPAVDSGSGSAKASLTVLNFDAVFSVSWGRRF